MMKPAMTTGPRSSVSARDETQTDLTEAGGPSANRVVQVAAVQSPGLALQLATAGVAACIADMITFPLDTTKVGVAESWRWASGRYMSTKEAQETDKRIYYKTWQFCNKF